MSSMGAVLVTGGAGFIGSSLVEALLKSGEGPVVNVDKLGYASVPGSLDFAKQSPRYHFEQADIADSAAVERIVAQHQPGLVFHLAAESHVDRSIDCAEAFVHSNVVGTTVLLEQSMRLWSGLSGRDREEFRFVHISTDEVYGDLAHPDDAADDESLRERILAEGFTEDTPYRPSSPYSASKASSDHFVRAWHRTHGLPIVIGNCSNNFGPRQLPEKLIPRVIFNAVAGKPLPVYGSGRQIRDWLYVNDHVEALLLLARRARIGESYNIGGGNERSNIDVIHAICDALEDLRPPKAKAGPVAGYRSLIEHITDRPGHDRRYAIIASKIKDELGWRARTGFEEGVRQTVSWYLENPRWCQSALACLAGPGPAAPRL